MLTSYADLLFRMHAELPKCPRALQMEHIRNAVRHFCRQTGIWESELTAIDVVADQQEYDLSAAIPEDTEILRMVSVKIDGAERNLNYYDLTSGPMLRWNTNHIPSSASTGGLVITVTLMPLFEDDTLPDNLLTRWSEAITYYARHSLMAMPGEPWSRPDKAAYYLEKYQDDESSAKGETYMGHKTGVLTLNTQEWF